jgi:leader peptidase (prepilin peptidase) / N-methyltransferase
LLWSILLPYIAFSAFEIQALGIQTNILSGVLSAIGAGGFFFFLFAVTRGRGMGFGDVIYALLMGFTLGFPGVIVGLYIAFVTGAIVSILLVFLKRKKFRGGTIPFGPFLVFGTFVSLFWGTQITNLFFRYLTH